MAGDHVGFHGPLKVLGVLNRGVLGVSENFLTLKEKKKRLWDFSLLKHLFIFIWLCRVLVAECRIFSCSMWDLVAKSRPPALGVWTHSHWITREAPFFKTWFWSNYRFKHGSVPGTLYPVPHSGYVLHNYQTIAQTGSLALGQHVCRSLFSWVWIHVTASIV